jgi:hypothetical protein
MRKAPRRKSSSSSASGRLRRVLRLESLEPRTVFNAAGVGAISLLDRVDPVFAPGTPAEVMAAYDDLPNQGGGIDAFSFNDTDRWPRTATNNTTLTQGDPTIITWSIAPDGTPISGFNGEPSAPDNLRSYLSGIYGTNPASPRAEDQPWFHVFQEVFDHWSAVSGVTYVYEPADDGASFGSAAGGVRGVRGDVRIGGHRIDGPSNILAYNFYPTVGDMVLDTGDSFFTNTASNSLRLRNTVAHEAGHGLGLGHVTPTNGTKLMEPSISLGFDGPQADDILAVNRGYGDRLEKNGGNNTAATSTNLGAVSGPFSVDLVSIDDDSDADWFRFTVGGAGQLSVTLSPTGSTYVSNSTTFNSLAQSNLALAVYDGSGTTVIASANVNAAGLSESLSGVVLPGSGTYYVRVTGSANAAQMYRLTGNVSAPSTPAPEIQVLDGSADIADNTGSVNLGSVLVGSTLTRTFTIRNQGTQDLLLGAAISLPTGYSLTAPWSGATLSPGASTSFTVAVDTSIARTLTGSISLATNDSDENPFNFSITATVTTTPTPPPSPGLPFTDNFNRATSSSLGSNWSERVGDLAVSGNSLQSNTSSVSLATVAGVSQSNVILSADMNLGAGTATRSMGLVARYGGSGDGNWYLANLRYTGGRYRVEIWKQVGGVQTLLSSAFVGSGVGSLRFEVVGSSLKVFWNGALAGSVNDSQLTTGGIGVRSNFVIGVRLDNFAASVPTSGLSAGQNNASSRAASHWQPLSLIVSANHQAELLYSQINPAAEMRARLLALIAAELAHRDED